MELEKKPRGIAIPLGRAVAADEFILTRNLSGTFSSGSVPIRAPLTVDDDDDDSGSLSEELNSASSYASNDSRGVGSGTDDDDGFGSVSGDADDETELEDVVVGGEITARRLIGEEVVGDGSDFSGGSVIYRPFAGDVEEETSVDYSSLEEESEKSDEVEGVSESEVSEADRLSVKAKVVIPRAILSMDDDEFDEILGSDDGEAALLRVAEAPSDAESKVGDKTFEFGDVGMVDEPGCSDSVIGVFVFTEEEVVRMSYLDELNNSLDEHSPGVPPGGSNQLIERGVVQRAIIKEDDDGSIHEFNRLMTPGDVEGVQDDPGELGELGMTDKPECSGSVSSEEDTAQVAFPEEDSLVVVPGVCDVFLVESEGKTVNADRGLDDVSSQLVEEGVGQESTRKESHNRMDIDGICEADELLIPGEESIVLGSKESGVEGIGTMISEAKGYCENDCSAISELEKPECEGELVTSMSSESFESTPNLDYVTPRNLEAAGGVVVVRECYSPDRKSVQEAENAGTQESKDIESNLSLLDEDRASSLESSFAMANEILENGEQVSEQIHKEVNTQFDSEPDKVSVGIEETSLLSVKDVDRLESERHMGLLIHSHTFMEVDEYEEKGDTREKRSESTSQKCLEESPSGHSLQLISGKVKERIKKTELLKAKIQTFIGTTDLCSESSAATEVESKPILSGEEHQPSLEPDYMSGGTETMLPEHEFTSVGPDYMSGGTKTMLLEDEFTSIGPDYMSGGTKTMLPEDEFPADQDFSINILVIGKTGVGKSATINSIFGETKSPVGAFGVTTKSANYVVGNIEGILVRILDTPGLVSSATEERYNQKVLMSIKKRMKTFPVDVVLYIDRLDENPDIHLLRTVTSSLGSSIWRNTIVVLTHAASIPPDSSNYDDFIAQRSSLMYQSIRQAVPELIDRSKMPRIVLAENNVSSFCVNNAGESTCPDWRSNLLDLCCSFKIQSKADKEKAAVFGSQLRTITLICSLWNALLPGNTCYSNDDLKEKKKHLLDSSYPGIFKDECVEQETLQVKNQEPVDEGRRHENEERPVVGRVRRGRRRKSIGFQATKRLGIYLDTGDLHTGFSIGSISCRRDEQDEEGRMKLVSMRGLMSALGLVSMLMISR